MLSHIYHQLRQFLQKRQDYHINKVKKLLFRTILKYLRDNIMKSQYLFSKGCCGVFLHKHEVLEISEGTSQDSEMVPMHIINKTPLQESVKIPAGPIAGKLWRNEYIKYCWKCKLPCGSSITHEIEGFKSKLSEVRTGCCFSFSQALPFCDLAANMWFNPCYCCCPRKYEVFDGQGGSLGEMTYSCCQLVCCVNMTVANRKDKQAFHIRPQCCVPFRPCGAGKWLITDRQEQEVANITKDCCYVYPHIQFSFRSHLSNADKILLISAVPHLP